MKRLYAVDWNPNGTNDLVITDDSGQVIKYISEALFGVRMRTQPIAEQTYLIDDFIGLLDRDEAEGFPLVTEITIEDALESIAVSPVSDGRDTIKTLAKFFGGAA